MTKTDLVRKHVGTKVVALQAQLLGGASSARATTARLRRAVARPAGSEPTVWEATLGELPEELVGKTDDPSFAESAVHLALALYATHQQSQQRPMHVAGKGLGQAVRSLVNAKPGEDFESGAVVRRFNALVTADSVDEMAWHLRSIITQFRSEGIPLDYAQLAGDLFAFSFPESRDSIRLRWGRQLYAAPRREPNE